jgi:hypothetical protein
MVALHDFQSKRGLEAQERPPITEPVIVNSVFITGMAVEVADSAVRIVGWEQTTDIGNGEMERRIVTRLAMSNDTARQFSAILREMLTGGGH